MGLNCGVKVTYHLNLERFKGERVTVRLGFIDEVERVKS